MSEEIFSRWQDPTIEKLQQENQQLKLTNQVLSGCLKIDKEKIDYYVDRCEQLEKVLDEIREYINKNECNYIYLDCKLYETEIYKHLLQILDKVGSNE